MMDNHFETLDKFYKQQNEIKKIEWMLRAKRKLEKEREWQNKDKEKKELEELEKEGIDEHPYKEELGNLNKIIIKK